VYERHKLRLRLQDSSSSILSSVGLYPGLLSSIDQSDFTMEFTVMLLDQILLTGMHFSKYRHCFLWKYKMKPPNIAVTHLFNE
jgi:hypothetical protein